jgi:hypothetical protein
MYLQLSLLSTVSIAQTASSPLQHRHPKDTRIAAVIADPLQQPAAPPPPRPPSTPEQMPPRAPVVVWDGKQLSIKSENATLADILIAVRGCMKASIEIPPGAAAERVATELGPGPAREVLTSLFAGSDFDYVIMASDTEEDGVRSILLTPRGKSDDSPSGAVVASGSSGIRRMPGYPDPARRSQESSAEPGSENSNAEASAGLERGAPSQEPGTAAAPTLALSQTGEADTHATVAEDVPANAGLAVANHSSTVSSAGLPSATAGVSNQGSSLMQMEQDLQRMYQQRRSIQAQQGQNTSTPAN